MEQSLDFIKTKSLGCICTSDDKCNPSGANIFYAVKHNKIYFRTHKDSIKVKHIQNNPNVCFVVVDEVDYEQIQLYTTAKVVDNPQDYVDIIMKVVKAHSEITVGAMIPYSDITTEGDESVVIELTPKNGKHFKQGLGLSEVTY